MYDNTFSLIITINLFIPLLYTLKKYVFVFWTVLSLCCGAAFLLVGVRAGCSGLEQGGHVGERAVGLLLPTGLR